MINILKPYGIPPKIKEEILNNWEKIRDDYLSLEENKIIEYKEEGKIHSEKNKWKVFKFRDHPFGDKINKDKCKFTHQILDKIPRLKGAAFSILEGNSKIEPHHGIKDATMRHHLGLIIPKKTFIKIDGEKKFWEEGKILSFDDTKLHEVQNLSNSKRVILMFDVQYKFSILWWIIKIIKIFKK